MLREVCKKVRVRSYLNLGVFKGVVGNAVLKVVRKSVSACSVFGVGSMIFLGFYPVSAFSDPIYNKIVEFLKTDEGQKAVFEAVRSYATKEQAKQQQRMVQEMEQKREEQFKNPVKIEVGQSPIIGNPKAKITIFEFSDFECPFCKRGAQTIQQVLERYGDEVRVVFKHRPLSFHKNAEKAHRAAWAAQQLGKFKQAKEFLFDNQSKLGDDNLYQELATRLSVPFDRLSQLMNSPEAQKAIQEDSKLADSLKIQGTPTFYINGVALEGAYPFEEFEKIINRWREQLRKK
ncbi:MAG: thioredoxin domain-containing protein [Deltaproteobacteria bacterium]|nr:thioredoxin domain-containing protein [Deltaproteobacteria bacterium]